MFEQNLNWGLAAQAGDKLAEGIYGLADMAGMTRAAQSRARAKQVLGGLSSLGQVDPNGLPMAGRMSLADMGRGTPVTDPKAAPTRVAGNPQPEQGADPFAAIPLSELFDLARNPRLDEFTRRTAEALYNSRMPKDPMEVAAQEADIAFKRAQAAKMARPGFDFMMAPDGSLLRTDDTGNFQKLGQFARPEETADNKLARDFATRQAIAAQMGLQPTDPRYQPYLLTGDMPREGERRVTPTEMKEVFEADDMARAAESTIGLLQQAKQLSAKAYDGTTAGWRGWATSQYGDEAGVATQNLNTVLTETALSQLKAIFGGAPTEGERQILLDISGSANQPRAVRDAIIDRAIKVANRRLQYNRMKAQQLRGGTFFDPQGGVSLGDGASIAPGGGQPQQQLSDPLGIR